MIGLVTELARQQQAAAEEARRQEVATKGRRYKEVSDGENGTRLVPARMGTAPLLTASDPDVEGETDELGENDDMLPHEAAAAGAEGVHEEEREERKRLGLHARKGMMSVGPQTAQVTHGGGAIQQALAGHVYAAQRNATMPSALADLQTAAAQMCSGPAFTPGQVGVDGQNFRTVTNAFTANHAPGQVPFHTAPINMGGQR